MLPFTLELGRPWVAALVAALGAVLLFRARPPGRPRLRDLPRALLLLVLALAAGDPRVRDPGPPRLRIFVVDRSRSFADAVTDVVKIVAKSARELDPERDRVAVVTFGAAPAVAHDIAPPRFATNAAWNPWSAPVDASSTDIGAALDLAGDLARAEPFSAEVVLFSDGRDTAGRAREAAARLAAQGVTIHALAPPLEPLPNARIARVRAPARVGVGEAARIEVTVESTIADRLTTSIEIEGPDVEVVGPSLIQDGVTGESPLERTFVVRPKRAGLFRITARIALASGTDAFPDDDVREVAIVAGDRARALLVSEGDAWRKVLEGAGFDVEGVTAAGLAGTLLRANPDLVVLDEVPAGDAPVAALRDYLASGGGLVVTGNTRAFGPGRYGESDLETLLPVRSGPPDARSRPLALEIVLDASGSMERRFVPAVDAVIPAAKEVRAGDTVNVITFSDRPVLHAGADLATIRNVTPGGSTNIGLALEAALDDLASREGRRLLVLVTDGEDEKVDAHLAAVHEKSEKLGADFQAGLITIGNEGKGTLDKLAGAIGEKKVQVFVGQEADEKLAKLVKGDLVAGARDEVRVGDFETVEGRFKIGSYAPVRAREHARTRLSVHDSQRVLPAALMVTGEHVLALATSLDGGGSSLAHEGLAALLEPLREVARESARDLEVEARREPGWIHFTARTDRTGLVAACEGERVALRPVAPGELEARLRAPRGPSLVSVLAGETPLGAVSVPAESELELAPPARDPELLEALTRPTGGRVVPELGPLPAPAAPKETARRALSEDLVLVALAILVLEGVLVVGLERIAARRAARKSFEGV